jgi:hypothetical protein
MNPRGKKLAEFMHQRLKIPNVIYFDMAAPENPLDIMTKWINNKYMCKILIQFIGKIFERLIKPTHITSQLITRELELLSGDIKYFIEDRFYSSNSTLPALAKNKDMAIVKVTYAKKKIKSELLQEELAKIPIKKIIPSDRATQGPLHKAFLYTIPKTCRLDTSTTSRGDQKLAGPSEPSTHTIFEQVENPFRKNLAEFMLDVRRDTETLQIMDILSKKQILNICGKKGSGKTHLLRTIQYELMEREDIFKDGVHFLNMRELIENHEKKWPSLDQTASVQFMDLLSRWTPHWAISQAWSENFRNSPDVLLVFDQFDGTRVSAMDIVKSVNNSAVKMVFVTRKQLSGEIFSGCEIGFVEIGPVSATQRIIMILAYLINTEEGLRISIDSRQELRTLFFRFEGEGFNGDTSILDGIIEKLPENLHELKRDSFQLVRNFINKDLGLKQKMTIVEGMVRKISANTPSLGRESRNRTSILDGGWSKQTGKKSIGTMETLRGSFD